METLYQIYAFIFGCLIGSFLNVVIIRIPKQMGLVMERSSCPKCGTQLRWFHNIPVLSFLLLRGKCAFCSAPISWRYPSVEILVGFISLWLFPASITVPELSLYLFHLSIAGALLAHFVIDLEHYILPDSINLYLLLNILPFAAYHFNWKFWLIGGLLGFGLTLFVTWIFYKLRGQVGLGGGDIKLYGILGILLGPTGIIFNIFSSCLLGALVSLPILALQKKSKDTPIPFGPFIIIVASFQVFFPEQSYRLQSFFFFS